MRVRVSVETCAPMIPLAPVTSDNAREGKRTRFQVRALAPHLRGRDHGRLLGL